MEPLIYSGRSRLRTKMFSITKSRRISEARIARNSQLLRRFEPKVGALATQKLDILDARYKFMNRSEVPYSTSNYFNKIVDSYCGVMAAC